MNLYRVLIYDDVYDGADGEEITADNVNLDGGCLVFWRNNETIRILPKGRWGDCKLIESDVDIES